MDNFVVVKNLTKRYGEVCAVDNLSFTVKTGEIFGMVGPNGAGKSTTLNVLTTLVSYDRGDITIGRHNLAKEERKIKKMIGMVPQEIAIYPNLTAYENVSFFASLYGMKGRQLKEATMEALAFVQLTDQSKAKPRQMSGGMKRRLNIACGIVHSPKLIVMDEPTVGVDAQSREYILRSINILREKGATVIYTSHYMPEVQEICDRITIIDKGRLVACGTEQELLELVTDSKSIVLETRFPEESLKEKLHKKLAVIPDVQSVSISENDIRIDVSVRFKDLSPLLRIFDENRLPIISLNSDSANLETTFLTLTGRDLR